MTKPPHVVPFPAGPTPQAWARPNDSLRLTLGCRGPEGPEKLLGKEGLKEWEHGWKASISKAWKKLRGRVFLNEGKGVRRLFLQVLGKEEGEPQHFWSGGGWWSQKRAQSPGSLQHSSKAPSLQPFGLSN